MNLKACIDYNCTAQDINTEIFRIVEDYVFDSELRLQIWDMLKGSGAKSRMEAVYFLQARGKEYLANFTKDLNPVK